MGVEFYTIESKNANFSIDDSTLILIEKSIHEFNERYSDVFDVYGKFRLYKNHQEYLRELLTPFVMKSQIIAEFITLLDECINKEAILIGIGD